MTYETPAPIAPPSNNKPKLLAFVILIFLVLVGIIGFFLWWSMEPSPPGPGPGTLPLPQEDKEAPTTPSNLVATMVSGSSVTLSWGASTDDVGVEGYRVYRDGVLVGETKTTRHTDTTARPAMEYIYVVTAFDKARHESLASEEVHIKTPDETPTQNDKTIHIKTSGGSPLAVKDFYKDAVQVTNDDVLVRDTNYYTLIYFPAESSFLITINDPNIRTARAVMELELGDTLGVEKQDLCELAVFINIPFDVNEIYSKKSYGLSFCPGGESF